MQANVKEFRVAFWNWRTVIALLMAQYLNNKFRGTKLSVFFALFEPLMMVAVFYFLRSLLHVQFPAFGTSPIVFFAAGVLPFYLFMKISRVARRNVGGQNRIPRIHGLDRMIASAATEALTIVVMLGLLFVGLYYIGFIEEARPRDIGTCFLACGFLMLLGFGAGLINAFIAAYFVSWRFIYRIFIRLLITLSGVFYVVDILPYKMRALVVWNPIAHGIEWFRVGLYGLRYPHSTLDVAYFVKFSIILLFVGLTLYQALNRREGERS